MSGTYQIPFFTNGTNGNPDSSTININGFHAKSAVRCGLCLEADTDGTPNTHNSFIWMRQDNGQSNGVIYLDESTPGNDMIFYNNTTQSTGTNRFRFTGAGTVNYNDFRITTPATYLTIDNNGILFQNGNTSLNWYEEGTINGFITWFWIPMQPNHPIRANYSLIYVRIGKNVTITLNNTVTLTSSGSMTGSGGIDFGPGDSWPFITLPTQLRPNTILWFPIALSGVFTSAILRIENNGYMSIWETGNDPFLTTSGTINILPFSISYRIA
jgi:hypothetical protein